MPRAAPTFIECPALSIPNATPFNDVHSSRAPNSSAASSASGSCTHANTVDTVHPRPTSLANQRKRIVGWRRRERHGLYR
jgi:hypothetical protein